MACDEAVACEAVACEDVACEAVACVKADGVWDVVLNAVVCEVYGRWW